MSQHSSFLKSQSILVVGGGNMGAGIAAALALAGLPVTICDRSAALADAAASAARRRAAKVADRLGVVAAEIAAGELATAAADAAVAIEAVFEDFDTKCDVLAQLATLAPPETLVTTNTSSLSVTELGRAAGLAERLVGLHFFHPAERSQLVEVVRTETVGQLAVELAEALVETIDRTSIVVGDAPGFLVNRLARPLYLESERMVEEGFEAGAVDAILRGVGLPIGPLEVADRIGLAVHDAVTRSVYEELAAPRLRPVPIVRGLLRKGRGGWRDGHGFHAYREGRRIDPAAAPAEIDVVGEPWSPALADDGSLADAGRAGEALAQRPFDADALEISVTPATPPEAALQMAAAARSAGMTVGIVPRRPGLVAHRVLACFVNEAFFVLGEGYAEPAEIELAVTLGLRHEHGPLGWVPRFGGVAKVVEILDSLDGEREVAPLLCEAARYGDGAAA